MLIDTPLLVVGSGPAALLVAKLASGSGLTSVVAGHEPLGGEDAEVLDAASIALLTPHGLLAVLRPYLVAADPPTIVPSVFEQVLKHHCVADPNVTVYDGLALVDRERRGGGVTGVLTDGRARWELSADAFVDATELPVSLSAAVAASAEVAAAVLAVLRRPSGGGRSRGGP